MQALDTQSTAQTNTELIAAPGAGKQIVVYAVFVSSDTAQTISLESGTTGLRWRQYVAANGGQVALGGGQHLFTCANNAALTYTTSAAGNVFVSVNYKMETTFDQSS